MPSSTMYMVFSLSLGLLYSLRYKSTKKNEYTKFETLRENITNTKSDCEELYHKYIELIKKLKNNNETDSRYIQIQNNLLKKYYLCVKDMVK